jgi:DNA repair exonuclease SbcCD ATPase subunit
LGGCSDTKSINVTAVTHRASSSSAAHSEFDPQDFKDMQQKIDRIITKEDEILNKVDQHMTKEEYEKAKNDLASEKKKNSELMNKVHDLSGNAKKMEQLLEEERKRWSSDSSKKDMDRSDLEQKCVDLQVDLDRRDQEVNRLKDQVHELEREKENMNEMQSTHNTKVSTYIDKMMQQHNVQVQKIKDLEGDVESKDQKIRELTSQWKDEKQKRADEITKFRVLEQQMKENRSQSSSLEEQINDLKQANQDLVKGRDQALKAARAEQNKLKVLDEQKRDLERERTHAADEKRQLESEKVQLESDKASLQDRVKKTIAEMEQVKEDCANVVSQAKRHRNEEVVELQNKIIEATAQRDTFNMDMEQAILAKDRAEQVLAEERQEFQISKLRNEDLKKQLERVDKERSRKMSVEHDKENQKLQETVKCQKAFIWGLESELRQERGACALLTPTEAARILKVREDSLIQDNNHLNIELSLVKDELQRLKGGKANQAPQLEIQQQPSFAEPSSLVSTPGHGN